MKKATPRFFDYLSMQKENIILLLNRFYFEQKMQDEHLVAIEREILRLTEPSHATKTTTDARTESLHTLLKAYYDAPEEKRPRLQDAIYLNLGRVGRDYQSIGPIHLDGEGRLLTIYVDFNNDTLQYIKDRISYYLGCSNVVLLDRYTMLLDKDIRREMVDTGRHIGHYGFYPGVTVGFAFTNEPVVKKPCVPLRPRMQSSSPRLGAFDITQMFKIQQDSDMLDDMEKNIVLEPDSQTIDYEGLD
uniref:Uncharacterized protein n=1 Tax=viral metagenome TaxID=1070528 RepID=A0A6C0L5H8_9ZZZZ